MIASRTSSAEGSKVWLALGFLVLSAGLLLNGLRDRHPPPAGDAVRETEEAPAAIRASAPLGTLTTVATPAEKQAEPSTHAPVSTEPGSATTEAKIPADFIAAEIDKTGPGRRYMDRYNGQSGRLANGQDFENRHGLHDVRSPSAPVALHVSTRQLEPGGQARVVLLAGETTTRIERAVAYLRIGSDVEQRPMTVQPDGSFAFDFLAEPRFFSGSPVARPDSEPPVEVDVVVDATVSSAGERKDVRLASSVSLENSGARLVRGTERLEHTADGNMQLSIDVDVSRAADYFFYAELWSVAGRKSIAFGRKAIGQLTPGRQRVSLIFGGQVIRDTAIDGPYVVRNVEFMRVSTVPPHSAEPIAELMQSPSWRALDF